MHPTTLAEPTRTHTIYILNRQVLLSVTMGTPEMRSLRDSEAGVTPAGVM